MYLIGIAGGSGSGKTTFAEKILSKVDRANITLLSMDSYYLPQLPDSLLTQKGSYSYDHPGAFDWELLKTHLTELKRGSPIEAPIYDFSTGLRKKETQTIDPKGILIFEGIFTLFDLDIRSTLDIMVFLHVDADIRFTRRLNRDVKERGRTLESVIEQYYETVRPMYQKYLDPQKQYADFIIGEESDIAASILTAKVRELLDNSGDANFNGDLERRKFDYDQHRMNISNEQ